MQTRNHESAARDCLQLTALRVHRRMICRGALQAIAALLVLLLAETPILAVSPTAEELQQNRQWVQQHLLGETQPFSFTYGGASSATLLPTWNRTDATVQLDAGRTQHKITWTDPATGLEVRCEAIEYGNHPVVEWTTYLRNTGSGDTPLIEDVRGLDSAWTRSADGEFTLRGVEGDSLSINGYKPYEQMLASGGTWSFAPNGGRPTDGSFPYYNLAMPDGGVTLAIGWPGRWSTTFTRDADRGLQITAGQEQTNLSLKPGEEIRTPLIAMETWKGSDTVRAQNLWRRWMREYSLPGAGGQPMKPMVAMCSSNNYPDMQSTAAGEIGYVQQFVRNDAKPDYWWLDAGWYPDDGHWTKTGTWAPDPVRYPNGVKELSDVVHANGMQMITWFEPERVAPGTWLAHNHPEWLLQSNVAGETNRLLNLGNPEALRWVTDHIDALITSEDFELYRQDFNIDPLAFWRDTEPASRQGITENAYVQGYLAFWDELRRRHPNLEIDSCASGGRRNDLETLRRSVPLWRSDFIVAPYIPGASATSMQCQTYGLASWVPYFGTGAITSDKYIIRSMWSPALNLMIPQAELDSAEGPDWEKYRRLQAEARATGEYMLGDYYPLTPYSQAEDAWMAWQFDCPDQGGGMVEAFRRSQSPVSSMMFQLHGLDPTAWYELFNFDTQETIRVIGSELMDKGFRCEIGSAAESALITYHVVPEPSSVTLASFLSLGLGGFVWRRLRRSR